MLIFGIIFNLVIIGIGLLIKKYPSMLSGYNTMSAETKKNVDMKSVAVLYNKGMILIGVIGIIMTTLLTALDLAEFVTISVMAPLFIGLLVISIKEQKYNKNRMSKFKKQLPVIIIVVLMLFIGISLGADVLPVKVDISNEKIEFSGSYGIEIDRLQIEKTELWYSIPSITHRTNGLGFGNTLKGHFKLDKLGKCCLFIKLHNPPYLYIELKNGSKIIYNSTDSVHTKEVYKQL